MWIPHDGALVPASAVRTAAVPFHCGPRLSYVLVNLASGFFVVLDLLSLLLATFLCTQLYAAWPFLHAAAPSSLQDLGNLAYLPALIAPFLLYEKRLGPLVSRRPLPHLARSHVLRFAVLAAVLLLLGAVSGSTRLLPIRWFALWFASALLLTSMTRFVVARSVRYLQHRGHLREVIAVVGAGPAADRLVGLLQQTPSDSVDLLGIFDDRSRRTEGQQISANGSLAQLIELGSSRRIDWILLTLPPEANPRINAIQQRLMALSAPIALYPAGTAPEAVAEPRDIVIDDHDLESFTTVARRFGQHQYGYVVTPNADHFIRLHDDNAFRKLYAAASYVLLDSRFIARLIHVVTRQDFPVCTGSDLTERLLARVARREDSLVLVGGTPEQARKLAQRYGLRNLHHHNPPMGFIHDPQAVLQCLDFIESHSPFRFCLLAVGSPQQEILALALKERAIARGLALCVGASINFLTGVESRAPAWMQAAGMEWLHRLRCDPARMGRRYLVRGPRVFGVLLTRRMRLRRKVPGDESLVISARQEPAVPAR
jgi:exopolysaccharide biosynthesis WecB/TagA/CpsF family protein